jgi:uncharacterized protein DUF6335
MAKRKSTRRGRRTRAAATGRRKGTGRPSRRTARSASPKRPPARRRAAAKTGARKTRTTRATAKRASAPTGSRKAAASPRPTTKPLGPPPKAGHGTRTKAPALDRKRRTLEETVPTPPSSLDMERHGSAARTGRAELREKLTEHTETGPALTGGDIDADWEEAYSSGDEAPGGDNPTPDQGVVDDIGRSLGVEYEDNEELRSADKIATRDAKRWELDPASSEDYRDRNRK